MCANVSRVHSLSEMRSAMGGTAASLQVLTIRGRGGKKKRQKASTWMSWTITLGMNSSGTSLRCLGIPSGKPFLGTRKNIICTIFAVCLRYFALFCTIFHKFALFCTIFRYWALIGPLLGPYWAHIEPILGPIGSLLGPYWAPISTKIGSPEGKSKDVGHAALDGARGNEMDKRVLMPRIARLERCHAR